MNSKALAPRLERLASAIAAAPDTRAESQLSHEECQARLEFYVDGESRGENARRLYPDVFKHLQACASCRTSYELLTGSPAVPSATDVAAHDLTRPSEPRVELPFVVQSAPDAAWSRRVRSPIGGAPLGFGFTINPSHLARTLAQAPQIAVRGETTAGRSLLLLDSIALGRREVQVELWLHRTDTPDFARLEISVVSSLPLPEPLRANLHLNDRQYPASLERGAAWIEQIPVSGLENARVSVEFEAGQPAPSMGA